MSQPKSNEELIEEFNKLHTASIAIQSGMMMGNNTEEDCLKSYERLEQFFAEALAQKDAEVAEMFKEMLSTVSTFEDHMTISGIALKYGYLEETKDESDFDITSEENLPEIKTDYTQVKVITSEDKRD